MKLATYEGTVENGQIKLSEPVRLPEHAKVYVVVAGPGEGQTIHMRSPRLAEPGRAFELEKEVSEEPRDAGLR